MSRRHSRHRFGLLLTAVLVALVLQIWPLFGGVALWRPQFVLLVLIFALIYRPYHYGIATAWGTGLVMDVLSAGPFGRYALALGICAYLLQILRRRLRHAPFWFQSGLVLLLVVVSQWIVVSINLLVQDNSNWRVIWYPAITSALTWPLVYTVMKRLARRRVSTRQ